MLGLPEDICERYGTVECANCDQVIPGYCGRECMRCGLVCPCRSDSGRTAVAQRHEFIAAARQMYQELGAQVATLRDRAGKTQAKLAEEAGLSRGQLEAFEGGKRRLSVVNLIKVANALGYRVRITLEG